jgi:hypothetical protein
MQEYVNLLPKYFRHQPKKGDGTIFFAKITKKTAEKRDHSNPFAVHIVNPFLRRFSYDLSCNSRYDYIVLPQIVPQIWY